MIVPRLAAQACSPGPAYDPVMGVLAPVPRICGREAEIGALGEAVGRVAAGAPAFVLVEGEAGIGKTCLLARVLQDARGRSVQVAEGRAEELERTRPFGVLAAAFGCTRSAADPRRAAIAGLLAARGGEGLSNPQIGQRLYVSRRTVQTHLGHVFAKLHITSRTQLAAETIRHRW